MKEKKGMSTPPIVPIQIEGLQIAGLQTVIDKRAEIVPLFEPLRQACGDAVCGPVMTIFHYGAVKGGLLVEAAFPVSQPVESGPVHTRHLEPVRAWSRMHRGSHETIREATLALLEHGRTHAGTTAGLREVYHTLDPEHPDENVTEVQLIQHGWERRLAQGAEAALGAEARQTIMQGIEGITPDSTAEAYAEWIRGAMDRLDALTNDPETKYQILSRCAHIFPEARITHLRSIYEQRHDVDDVLREMYDDPDWYEDPVRQGHTLYVRKVPFDPARYEEAATPAERRRAYCHCDFVRPYLNEVPSRMSSTFCWCGSGWYRRLWEGILDQPVAINHVETLLQGADECRLTIHLPLALDGEMSPAQTRSNRS
jgi:hypothetical protein